MTGYLAAGGRSCRCAQFVRIAALVLGIAIFATRYAGAAVVDQSFPGGAGWALVNFSSSLAQTFPVTVGGRLERVDVYVNRTTGQAGNLLWDIRPLTGAAPAEANNAALASGSIPIANLPVYFQSAPVQLDVSSSLIEVHPGDQLAIVLRSDGSGVRWLDHDNSNPGRKYLRSELDAFGWEPDNFTPTQARGFATYVQSIPEPSSLSIALAAAVGVSLRRCENVRRVLLALAFTRSRTIWSPTRIAVILAGQVV